MVSIGIRKEKLWTKNFIFQALANFFLFFGFQLLLPTIPVFIMEQGMDLTAVGLVVSTFTISSILVRPFSGAAFDKFGIRLLTVIGLLLCLGAIGFYYWATTLLLILTLRVLHGFGWGVATTSYGTMIADIVPASRRGEGMGYYGISSNLAMALAPPFGIWIMLTYGFKPLFIASMAATLISLTISQFVSIPTLKKRIEGGGQPSFFRGLIEKRALFPALLMMLMTVSYGGIVTFIALYSQELGLAQVGIFFTVYAFCLVIIRPISGRLYDSLGHSWVLISGSVSGLIGLLLLSYASSTFDIALSAVFYGASFGSIQSSLMAWTIHRVAPQRRGAATAVFFSAFDGGIALGAIMLGTIASYSGSYAIMYRTSAFLCLPFLIIYLLYFFFSEKRS